MMIRIVTEPEARIEPGHQWLIVPDSPSGRALADLLHERRPLIKRGGSLLIPHDEHVDQVIVQLIDELARVRYESPVLVQLTMVMDEEEVE
ncbi:MAG TPA: hypothetical protein VJ785_01090 [Anaerolineales bacterium]|nr:hypothetical protein [Anaerolineales bacterium]